MLIIKQLQESGVNIKDKGHPADYVKLNIRKTHNSSFEYTQCTVTDAIISDIKNGKTYTKPVPDKVSLQLHAFHDSPKFDGNFNYQDNWFI